MRTVPSALPEISTRCPVAKQTEVTTPRCSACERICFLSVTLQHRTYPSAQPAASHLPSEVNAIEETADGVDQNSGNRVSESTSHSWTPDGVARARISSLEEKAMLVTPGVPGRSSSFCDPFRCQIVAPSGRA